MDRRINNSLDGMRETFVREVCPGNVFIEADVDSSIL